jgi:hypothetical protein
MQLKEEIDLCNRVPTELPPLCRSIYRDFLRRKLWANGREDGRRDRAGLLPLRPSRSGLPQSRPQRQFCHRCAEQHDHALLYCWSWRRVSTVLMATRGTSCLAICAVPAHMVEQRHLQHTCIITGLQLHLPARGRYDQVGCELLLRRGSGSSVSGQGPEVEIGCAVLPGLARNGPERVA